MWMKLITGKLILNSLFKPRRAVSGDNYSLNCWNHELHLLYPFIHDPKSSFPSKTQKENKYCSEIVWHVSSFITYLDYLRCSLRKPSSFSDHLCTAIPGRHRYKIQSPHHQELTGYWETNAKQCAEHNNSGPQSAREASARESYFPWSEESKEWRKTQVKLLPHYRTYFVFFVEFIEAKVILSRLISINPIHMITFFLPYSNFLLQMAYLTALIVKSPKWFYMLKSRCWKHCVPFRKL